MSWLAISAVVAALAPVVGVDGDAACPSPPQVAARLYALLPAAATAGGPADVARIDRDGDQLSIVLRRPDGTLVGARQLAARGTCDEQARAAAVVLATWASDVHPEFRPPVPPAPPLPPRVDSAPSAPPVVALSPPHVAPGPRWRWDAGAAVSAVQAGEQAVLGARLVGGLVSAGGWGARLGLAGEGDRTTATGPGQSIWSRWSAAIGPQRRWALGAPGIWAVDAHASFEAALFRARGAGFPVGYTDSGLDGGLSAGVRLLIPGSMWRPWLAVDGTRWLGQRTVRENVSGQQSPLATWMIAGSLGFGFFAQ